MIIINVCVCDKLIEWKNIIKWEEGTEAVQIKGKSSGIRLAYYQRKGDEKPNKKEAVVLNQQTWQWSKV